MRAPGLSVVTKAALALGASLWAGYALGAQGLLPLRAVRRGPAPGRRVALSFDDGPDPAATPRVLDRLAARSVHATFFLVGERAAACPGLVRAIAAAGHEIGSHGLRHRNAWILGPAATREEVLGGVARLADILGTVPRLYRPPWGLVNAETLRTVRRAGLRIVLWSLQPEGLRPVAAAAQLRYCAARLRAGAIVDLHDAPGLAGAPERCLALLPGLLDVLDERGLGPVPVGELLDGLPDVSRGAAAG
jgi:peptidoglycan/xylan/chitin deacetylase (PgdA/CDA1 family)